MSVPVAERGGRAAASPRTAPAPPQTDRASTTDRPRNGHHRAPRPRRDPLGQVCRQRPVEHEVPVGKRAASCRYAAGDASMEAVVLPLDPVALAGHPRHGVLRADLEQDRQIGHQPLDGGEVELEHALEPEAPRDSLIGDRRVDVAIADHRRSSRERGPDHLLDVLGARGCVERGLGPRRDVASVEHEVADLLSERRAARLARQHDLDSRRLRGGRASSRRLRRLAGAVEALQSDEHRR